MDLDLCPCYWLSDHRDSDSLGTVEQGEREGNPWCIANGLEDGAESGVKEETTLSAIRLAQ